VRHALALAALACALAGCVEAISAQDAASLRDAQRLDFILYTQVDSGEVRALARASYCASESVLRRNDASAYDAGWQMGSSAILCEANR
jgi:hypothetical protein